jgi:hypothetical protein
MGRNLRPWIAVLLALTLVGCSSSPPSQSGTQEDLHAAFRGALPPLPDDRAASEVFQTDVAGSDTYDSGGTTIPGGGHLELVAGPGETSWGMWQLAAGPTGFPTSVEFEISGLTGAGVYVGISDYAANSWDFSGPFASSREVELDAMANMSGGGNVYLVLLVWGDGLVLVENIHLFTDSKWVILSVGTQGNAGKYASLAVVNGTPAISYYDATTTSLKFARSSTPTGESQADWSAITVDNVANVGQHTSLALINGNPAISYYDATNGDLKYAWSNSPDGMNPEQWTYLTVENAGDVGTLTSLAEVDGRPAISFCDVTNNDVRYALSSSANGTSVSDWSSILLDDFSNSGEPEVYIITDTSLLVADDRPCACYGGISIWDVGFVTFASSSTVDGALAADWSEATCSYLGFSGMIDSAIIDGHPAVCNSGMTVDEVPRLVYNRATTPSGQNSTDWPEQLDLSWSNGDWPTLANIARKQPVSSQRPAMASTYAGYLVYTWSATSTGSQESDWTTEDVGHETYAEYCSIACVDGRAAIAFYESNKHRLYYAIRMGD